MQSVSGYRACGVALLPLTWKAPALHCIFRFYDNAGRMKTTRMLFKHQKQHVIKWHYLDNIFRYRLHVNTKGNWGDSDKPAESSKLISMFELTVVISWFVNLL